MKNTVFFLFYLLFCENFLAPLITHERRANGAFPNAVGVVRSASNYNIVTGENPMADYTLVESDALMKSTETLAVDTGTVRVSESHHRSTLTKTKTTRWCP
jgi:hypothetical protein